MRTLWIRIIPSLSEEEKKTLIEATADFCAAYIVDPNDEELTRQSGAKTIVSPKKGDILLLSIEQAAIAKDPKKVTCIVATVRSRGDEERLVKATDASVDYVAIKCPDWKVIPLENLIAKIHGKSKLLAWVTDFQEAKTALEALEIGVDGVITELSDVAEIERIYEELQKVSTREGERETGKRLALQSAKVIELRPIGSGARVCVDTCDLMKNGEGMLVGCQSSGLFLIQAEIYESPYVNPRPFRVNAGSLAHYTLTPNGKTSYLSELRSGDEVLIVDREGRNRATNVCRVKIEWRPLILIEAECEGKKVTAIVQNAETIRVVTKDGHKSINELNPGDEVLVYVEEGGRHFGTRVKEERVIER